MTRTKKFIIGGVAVALLVLATDCYRRLRHYTLTDVFYTVLLGWATDTSWAKDYSEGNFAKVTIGMTQEEVRNIMGDPVWKPTPGYWGYTYSPSGTHYHQRGFVFSESGSVTQIVRGFYFD